VTTTLTVTVGPLACAFGNENKAMNLRTHHHTANVFLTWTVAPGEHGYPSFKDTNDALRTKLQELTKGVFLDATNEDVATRLFDALKDFRDPSWEQYGGDYRLTSLSLDVFGVLDSIGHDEGATRYTVTEG
jgi:hypothetical protein